MSPLKGTLLLTYNATLKYFSKQQTEDVFTLENPVDIVEGLPSKGYVASFILLMRLKDIFEDVKMKILNTILWRVVSASHLTS